MSSAAKALANRNNAHASTGPRTQVDNVTIGTTAATPNHLLKLISLHQCSTWNHYAAFGASMEARFTRFTSRLLLITLAFLAGCPWVKKFAKAMVVTSEMSMVPRHPGGATRPGIRVILPLASAPARWMIEKRLALARLPTLTLLLDRWPSRAPRTRPFILWRAARSCGCAVRGGVRGAGFGTCSFPNSRAGAARPLRFRCPLHFSL